MTAGHLAALWRAETVKLFSRTSARVGLLVAVGLAVASLLAMAWLSHSDAVLNGVPLSESMADIRNAPGALRWGLLWRNFFVLRAFVILVGAQSVAGELQARTLREDLLRPVARWGVLLAKWGALGTWIAATLGIAWLISAAGGAVLLGTGGPWGEIATLYLATWACDVGFATFVILISLAVRGVAGTVMGVFLFMVFNAFLGWALYAAAMLGNMGALFEGLGTIGSMIGQITALNPWLPSYALAAWAGDDNGALAWQSFVSLGVLTTLALGISERLLARLDVP